MGTINIIGTRANRIFDNICNDILSKNAEGHRCYLIVPSQFAIEAEKCLLSGNDGTLIDIDVVSPQRLKSLILETGTCNALPPANDMGKEIAMSIAVYQAAQEKKLEYYRSASSSNTFVMQMLNTISEISSSGYTTEDILTSLERNGKIDVPSKGKDIVEIWDKYSEMIGSIYQTDADYEDSLIKSIPICGLFENSYVWVYGFEVLQGDFCRFLKEISRIALNVQIFMTMDSTAAPDGKIFLAQQTSAARMQRIASKFDSGKGSVQCSLNYISSQGLNSSVPIRMIEKYLFAVPRKNVQLKFENQMTGVQIATAENPVVESGFIVSTVKKWHEVENISWNKIAVYIADQSSLETVLVSDLKNAGIPIAYDTQMSPMMFSVLRYVVYTLRCVGRNFSTDDVFQLLDTGMAIADAGEIAVLKSYAVANGIDHAKWLSPFTRGEYETCEEIRLKLVTPLEELKNSMRSAKTALDMLTVFQEYLMLHHIAVKELIRSIKLETAGEFNQNEKERQVNKKLTALFSELNLHFKKMKKKPSLKEFSYYFENAISSISVKPLPVELNSVNIGEPGHMMLQNIEAVILCGMQDGVMSSSSQSLLTRADKKVIEDGNENSIGISDDELLALRITDFYRTVSVPSQKLTVTYSLCGIDGSGQQPARLITDMQQIFPKVEVINVSGKNMAEGNQSSTVTSEYVSRFLTEVIASNLDDFVNKEAEEVLSSHCSKIQGEKDCSDEDDSQSSNENPYETAISMLEKYVEAKCDSLQELDSEMQVIMDELREKINASAKSAAENDPCDIASSGGIAKLDWEKIDPDKKITPTVRETVKALIDTGIDQSQIQKLTDFIFASENGDRLVKKDSEMLLNDGDVSISKLETFAECPFKHFIKYCIQPSQKEEFVYRADQKGTFFHQVLQNYTTIAMRDKDWPKLTQEKMEQYIEAAIAPVREEWKDSPLEADNSSLEIGEQYIRYITQAIRIYTKQMANGKFNVLGREVTFGSNSTLQPIVLKLSNGRIVKVQGKIDRIDGYEDGFDSYVRVVDYKSSAHELQPDQVWNGLQLQLLTYLEASEKSGKGMFPAGAFYFTVKDPMVDTDEQIISAAEKKVAEELHLKGIVLADAKVINAMDADEPGFSIGKKLNKDGTFSKNSHTYTLDEMQCLIDHSHENATRFAEQIAEGNIAVSPVRLGDSTSCKNCPYSAVCGFDARNDGDKLRAIPSMNEEKLHEKIAEEMQKKKI